MYPYQNLSLEDMPCEIWKDIPGWEGFYQVSNYGRIKSSKRTISDKNGITRPISPRIIKTHPSGKTRAYLGFGSHRNGKSGRIYVHKAVAMAFIENPEHKPTIDHIDTNTFNNNVNNLRWTTVHENLSNPITSKKISKAKSGKNCFFYGKRLHAKPILRIAQDGSTKRYECIQDAVKDGFCHRSINYCINGEYSHHKGYKWKYCS